VAFHVTFSDPVRQLQHCEAFQVFPVYFYDTPYFHALYSMKFKLIGS